MKFKIGNFITFPTSCNPFLRGKEWKIVDIDNDDYTLLYNEEICSVSSDLNESENSYCGNSEIKIKWNRVSNKIEIIYDIVEE